MQSDNIFEIIKRYPDPVAEENYAALVGIDQIKQRMEKEAAIMLNPEGVISWSKKFYKKEIELVRIFKHRPPLFILAGDVGTGKTAFAESFADPVARSEKIEVVLYKLSLNTRGSGMVGEMTKLIGDTFEQIRKEATANAGKKTTRILFIDEADALAQSREATQMHHEDRSGVNALIRGIDSLQNLPIPVIIIMSTNRYLAIDPAIRRRSAATFIFKRPSVVECKIIFKKCLSDTGLTEDQIDNLASLCTPYGNLKYGYTYSDLTQRVLPSVLLNVYPENSITFEIVKKNILEILPTAPFNEFMEEKQNE
jgi:SpoVK/Ycf46/Vps4 family AAA+-type ATPase